MLKNIVWMLVMLASACAALAAEQEPQDGNSFAVTDVRVFDGERVLPRTTVIVRDGRIDSLDAGAPDDLPRIDGTGLTLIPGLIDSHVHVFPGAQADALRFGVTTALDMYHLGGEQAAAEFQAQREAYRPTTAADTWSSLTGVTPPGGHPSQMASTWGVDIPTLAPDADIDAHVATRIEEGADYVKIIQDDTVVQGTPLTKFAPERLERIIDSVHARDRLAVVHVSAHDEARLAVASGADVLAHVFQDRPAEPDLVALARERNVAVIATLSVLARASGSPRADQLAAEAHVQPFLSEAQQQTLAADFGTPEPEIIAAALESVRRFHATGVPVLAGSDAPNPGTAHGLTLHQELELFVDAGMTPQAALMAATSLPAARFGLDDRGRIAPGYRADLVLVRGDPTADVSRTRHIERIWKNGYPVERALPPL